MPPDPLLSLATRTPTGIHLASDAARATWPLARLSTQDGHVLMATLSASLRAIDEPAERAALAEVLLRDRPALSASEAAAHLQPAIDRAARELAPSKPADEWLTAAGQALLCSVLRRAADAAAFACGLAVLPPFDLQLSSPSREAAADRDRDSAEATRAHAERFDQLRDTVARLQELEQSTNDPAIITRALGLLDPADRRAIDRIRRLGTGSSGMLDPILAVAGTTILRLDPSGKTEPTAIALPDGLGPFRSISPVKIGGKSKWVLGGRDKLVLLTDGKVETALHEPTIRSTRGFSSAVVYSDWLIAAHGEAGIIGWDLYDYRPARLWTPLAPSTASIPNATGAATGARNLAAIGEHAYFSDGGQLMRLTRGNAESVGPAAATIIAILPIADGAYIVREDGSVDRLRTGSLRVDAFLRRPRRLVAAATLGPANDASVLLAAEDGAIDAFDPAGDPLPGFVSRHGSIRRLVAAGGTVAALIGDRTRIVAWPAWNGRSPAMDVSIAALTPHRVADLAIEVG